MWYLREQDCLGTETNSPSPSPSMHTLVYTFRVKTARADGPYNLRGFLMAKKVDSAETKTGVDRWRAATNTEVDGKSSSKSKKRKNNVARQNVRLLAVVVVLAVAALGCCYAFLGSLQRSVELTGGNELVFSAASSDTTEVSSEQLSEASKIISSRLDGRSIKGYKVSQSDGKLLVDVPFSADTDSLSTIGQTGKVEFVRVDQIGDAEAMAKIQNGTEDVQLEAGTYTAFLDETHIKSSQVSYTTSSSTSSDGSYSIIYVVVVNFDDEGSTTFAEVTKELAESSGQIAIVVDGVVQSAPSVSEEITGGQVSISGDFTLDEASQLNSMIGSGSLLVTLTHDDTRAVDPVLSLRRACIGFGIALACVILVGFVVFRLSGLVLAGAPALACSLTMGWFGITSAAGASFILTLGALIAIFAAAAAELVAVFAMLVRFRGGVASGLSIRSAALKVADAAERPAAVVFGVAFVIGCILLFVGSSQIQGIALALAFGIAADGAAIVLLAVPALRVLGLGAASKKPGLWGVKGALAAAGSGAAEASDEPADDNDNEDAAPAESEE